MEQYVVPPRTSWITAAVTAALYALLGLLTLQVASYTGLAAPIWPAAGLAFALVYQRGWPVAVGVAVGSFAVNAGTLATGGRTTTVVLVTGGAIAVGAALEALVGAMAVTRAVGRHPQLNRAGQILAFLLLAGPVACVVNPTVGVAAQLATGVIAPSEALLGWVTWWAGDSIGVIVFAPIVLMLLPEQRDVWQDRRWKVAVPSLAVTTVLLAAFVANRDLDQTRLHERQDQIAQAAATDLQAEVARHAEVLHGIRGLELASQSVEPAEFRQFVEHSLERFSNLQAVSWDTAVTAADLDAFVAQQRAEPGRARFTVTQKDSSGAFVPVRPRASYVIVTYIEPLATNKAALGYDISSNPVRAAAIDRARDTGEMTSTAPITLVQETGEQQGMLTLLPVYRNGIDPGTVEGRRRAVVGYAVGVYRLGSMLSDTFAEPSWSGVGITLLDATDPAAPVEIARQTGTGIDAASRTVPQRLDVNGRTWILEVTASASALGDVRSTNIPVLLLGGVLVIGLLEAFLLLVTGLERAARRDAEVSTYDALHDPLTDAMNVRGFRQAIRAIRKRTIDEGSSHVLLYIDLDDFRTVNSIGGHAAGDEMLVQVAAAMHRNVRRRDVVARLGGDEFAVVLNDCGVERGLAIARQIVESVRAIRVRAKGQDLTVGLSIGAVVIEPPEPPDTDELLATADRACFAAKHAGGAQVMLASD